MPVVEDQLDDNHNHSRKASIYTSRMQRTFPPALGCISSGGSSSDRNVPLEGEEPNALSARQWSRQPVALANTLIGPPLKTTEGTLSPGPLRPSPRPLRPLAVRQYIAPGNEFVQPSHILSPLQAWGSEGGLSGPFSNDDISAAPNSPVLLAPSQPPSSSFFLHPEISCSLSPASEALSMNIGPGHQRGSSGDASTVAEILPTMAAISLRPTQPLKRALSAKPKTPSGPDEFTPHITAPVGNACLAITGQPEPILTSSLIHEQASKQPLGTPAASGLVADSVRDTSPTSLTANRPDVPRDHDATNRLDARFPSPKSPVAKKTQKLTRSFSKKIGRLSSIRGQQTRSENQKAEGEPVRVHPGAPTKPKVFRELRAVPILAPAIIGDGKKNQQLTTGLGALFHEDEIAPPENNPCYTGTPGPQAHRPLSPVTPVSGNLPGDTQSPLSRCSKSTFCATPPTRKSLGSFLSPRRRQSGQSSVRPGHRTFHASGVKSGMLEGRLEETVFRCEFDGSSKSSDELADGLQTVGTQCEEGRSSGRFKSKLKGLVGNLQK